MKKLLPFLILFICSTAEAKFYPQLKGLDRAGVGVSSDLKIACDPGSLLVAQTGTTWACSNMISRDVTLTDGSGNSPSLIFDASTGDSWSIYKDATTLTFDALETSANVLFTNSLSFGEMTFVIKGQGTSNGTLKVGETIQLGTADNGVAMTHDSDGAITYTGQGNGNDENLKLNFDDGVGGANTIEVTSSTGATRVDFTSIGLSADYLSAIDTNHGGNAGTDICIGADNRLCACGSCA